MSDGTETTPMVMEFVERFMANKEAIRGEFADGHPDSYIDIVRLVVRHLRDDDRAHLGPVPGRIHEINDGDYQGTLVYVIGGGGYQPSRYWWVMVDYGSCSGCDTLEGIREYGSDAPTESQIDEYMTLALHIVQGLRPMAVAS